MDDLYDELVKMSCLLLEYLLTRMIIDLVTSSAKLRNLKKNRRNMESTQKLIRTMIPKMRSLRQRLLAKN